MSTRTKHRIRNLAALAAVTCGLIAAPSANAGVLISSASNCDSQTLAQPFLPWADVSSYTLNPGGSFEGASSWSLSGGAGIAAGNEPWQVGSASDGHSLALPDGSSATGSSICVGIEHPTLRFFAKGSNPSATLRVDVLFEDALGNVRSLPIGAVTGNTRWAPTAIYPLVVNLLPLLPGQKTAVAFRFTASGGTFQVDDVYVDPYCRN
jgi:hypothetical protein